MKRIIIAAFITVILSVSLFANENYSYYEPYTYFIYNENSLTQEQLSQINHLKNEYQTKIEKLRKKMYLERTKINLEMAKQNPDSIIINNSIKLNMEYNRQLKTIINEFLSEYRKIKNNN